MDNSRRSYKQKCISYIAGSISLPTVAQLPGKLVFGGFASKFSVIARPVRRLVVAIPRLERKCIDNCPTGREILRFLVVIATWFHSSGGLPHQRARWFAMTALSRQTPICRAAEEFFRNVRKGQNNCQFSIVNCQFGEAAPFPFSPHREGAMLWKEAGYDGSGVYAGGPGPCPGGV